MSINSSNIVDVKDLALPGQRVIKISQDGKDIFIPVGLSSLDPSGASGENPSIPEGINVTPADVKTGVYYVDSNGEKQVGSMPSYGDVDVILRYSDQELPSGYYNKIRIPDVDTISQSDFIPFRCIYQKYTPESVVMRVAENAGLFIYYGDLHVSLVGTYTLSPNNLNGWLCQATTAFEENGIEYKSAQIYITQGYSGVNLFNWEFLYSDDSITMSILSQKTGTPVVPYPWLMNSATDWYTDSRKDLIIPTISAVDESSFIPDETKWFGGYFNTATGEDGSYWGMAMDVKGFKPEVGSIYSHDTKYKVIPYNE